MPPIQFKLTKSDDFTRRATFQQLPNWNELAAKLQALYNISADRVGVSYIDNDNDEITVNSNEELQDFYQGSYKSGQVIKLHVLDLNKTRETPRIPTANRNTFGQDDFDFPADNDWQRLPPFSIAELFMGKESVSDGPHAFVEVLDSDISGFGKDVDNMSDTDSEGGRSTVQPSSVDKGKDKSSSFGAASVTSLVAEEASEKYPVHVLDHGSVKNGPPPSAAPPAASNPFSDPQPNITAQSTPKVQSQKVDTPQAQDTSVDVNMEDPPLPELDAPQQSNASASLSSDIASVLTTFTSVISSHPELSEGVRNIIRNATNGTYWQSHRSAMSQAAREMSRPAEEYNHDEAVRRISDALGGIFRSLSQTSANGESGNQQANQPANANPFDWHTPHFMRPPPPGGRAPWSRRFTTALDEGRPWHHWYAPPWTAGPHHPHGPPPPPPPPGFPGPPPPSDRTPPPPPPPPPAHGSPVPPPPPPPPAQPEPHFPGHLPGSPPLPPPPSPPPSHHRGPPPHQRGPPPEDDAPHRGPPPPGLPPGPPGPPPPPFGPHGPMPPPPHGSPFHHPHYHHHGPPPPPPPPPGRERDRVGPFYGRGMRAYGPAPFANPFATFTHTNGSRMSSEEMRAQLERAKAAYKAQKETYRQERELRKRERDRIMAAHRLASGESNNANPVTTQASSSLDNLQTTNIVSNAWGPYPQYEIQSIPRRSNTHPGHGLRRTERKSEDLYSRSLSRITKRLADMGFSETSHAELPEKIKSQLPTSGVISKEKEDDVVTTLLEDLLVSSPKPPVASGSGSRRQESREGAAGSWQ